MNVQFSCIKTDWLVADGSYVKMFDVIVLKLSFPIESLLSEQNVNYSSQSYLEICLIF